MRIKLNKLQITGIALASIMAIPAFSGSASAGGTSLVDILKAKGVLTEGEAKAAEKDAKAHHKHLKFGGRVQADYAFYADDPGLDLGDGQQFRRARLFASGRFGDWHFKGQYDFAGNKTTIKDAYIKYTGFHPISIKAGNFKEAFSLEELTSSKYITFMERALPNAFAPSRHIGVGLGGHGDFWSAAIGTFGGSAAGSTKSIDSNFDLTGRITVAPIHEKTTVVHLGGAIAYRLPDSKRAVRVRERPESHVTHFRLVDTGTITNVDNVVSYGLEGAVVYGPFSVQGEYIRSDVNFQNAGPTPEPTFDGWYVYGSWFLTGESRPYSVKKGTFGRVHPDHNFGANGWGAWEVAVRYSRLNLQDQLVLGGKENDLTVGLNWYPHKHVRFMFNYVHPSVDNSPLIAAHPLIAINNFSPDVYQFRAQVDF